MDPVKVADMGLSFFTVAGLIWLMREQILAKKDTPATPDLVAIIERNTEALADNAAANRERTTADRELVAFMQAEREAAAAREQQMGSMLQTVLTSVSELVGMMRGR